VIDYLSSSVEVSGHPFQAGCPSSSTQAPIRGADMAKKPAKKKAAKKKGKKKGTKRAPKVGVTNNG